MYNIGIDFGGTNIVTGLVSGIKLIDTISFPTQLYIDPGQTIEAIARDIRQLLSQNGVAMEEVVSIGAGVPGTANLDTGNIEYANNIGFYHTPFCQLLEQQLGKPVYFDNDANAAALGEYLIEESKAKSFVLVTLGTGIGCGMILNGKIYRGVNYAEGEIGHMTIRYDGKPCNCGRRGCFEAYASSRALVEQIREELLAHPDSVLWKLCKQELQNINGKLFFEAVSMQDAAALQIRGQYVEYLSQGLANLINILQPEELRIGGGISRAGEYFLPQVKERIGERIYSRTSKRNTDIRVARAYNEAGIIGAALLDTITIQNSYIIP